MLLPVPGTVVTVAFTRALSRLQRKNRYTHVAKGDGIARTTQLAQSNSRPGFLMVIVMTVQTGTIQRYANGTVVTVAWTLALQMTLIVLVQTIVAVWTRHMWTPFVMSLTSRTLVMVIVIPCPTTLHRVTGMVVIVVKRVARTVQITRAAWTVLLTARILTCYHAMWMIRRI
jgi:hypothetical protein